MSIFEKSRVLVTGGTGSFGQVVVKYMLDKGCEEVTILSRDEAKQEFMRSDFNESRIKFHIGDVRDYDSVVTASRGVDYIFSAAALKQVPSCEFFPIQAVKTNVFGNDNVIKSALANGVKKVVCLSTDKAVYPINAMGMSKAMMEKVAQSHARSIGDSGPVISCVRYGNVMYSRGSVIPLFIDQIKKNEPITITDPGMTRFLLALPESVELVEHAMLNGEQGDVFIKKAPACTVQDLAAALKNIFNSDVETREIGIRHGEKIYETLASKEELLRSEDMGNFYRISMDSRDLNYKKYVSEGETTEMPDDYTSHNTYRLSVKEVEEILLELPEVRMEAGVE